MGSLDKVIVAGGISQQESMKPIDTIEEGFEKLKSYDLLFSSIKNAFKPHIKSIKKKLFKEDFIGLGEKERALVGSIFEKMMSVQQKIELSENVSSLEILGVGQKSTEDLLEKTVSKVAENLAILAQQIRELKNALSSLTQRIDKGEQELVVVSSMFVGLEKFCDSQFDVLEEEAGIFVYHPGRPQPNLPTDYSVFTDEQAANYYQPVGKLSVGEAGEEFPHLNIAGFPDDHVLIRQYPILYTDPVTGKQKSKKGSYEVLSNPAV